MLGERDQLCRLRMLIRKYVHRVLKKLCIYVYREPNMCKSFFYYLFIF